MAKSRFRYTPLGGEDDVKPRASLRDVTTVGFLMVLTTIVSFIAGRYTAVGAVSDEIISRTASDQQESPQITDFGGA